MSNKEPPKADILQGTLDLMVLHTLETLGPLHGYAIAARLEQVSGGAHRLNMGTLYPGLMRLEQRGLVARQVGRHRQQPQGAVLRDHGGRAPQLATEKAEWDRTASIIHTLLREPR